MTTDIPRLTDDELDALLTAHCGQPGGACWHQDHETLPAWPCETWRLATEVKDLRTVREAAVSAHERLFEHELCLCDDGPYMGFDGILDAAKCDLQSALARYEEGGR